MKNLKKFFSCVVLFSVLSSPAIFAYPGKNEELLFSNWIFRLASAQRLYGKKSEAYSDKFDEKNKTKGLPISKLNDIYSADLLKNHKGCCRFGCSAVTKELTRLGFENYQLLAKMSDGTEHCSNLFWSQANKCWLTSDFSGAVGFCFAGKNQQAFNMGIGFLQSYINYIKNVGAIGIAVRNVSDNENLTAEEIGFLDIREFLIIHNVSGIEIPTNFAFLTHPDHDRILFEKVQQVELDKDSGKWK